MPVHIDWAFARGTAAVRRVWVAGHLVRARVGVRVRVKGEGEGEVDV